MKATLERPRELVSEFSNIDFVLTESEVREFRAVIASALAETRSFDDREFLKNLPLHTHRVPERLRRFLVEFKYRPNPQGYCTVSNFPIDDVKLGKTPTHWQLETNNDTCKEAVMAMCMYAALTGDLFGWMTQQDGRMVHDVCPIRKFENEQLGTGSNEELWWHTEDAFHELRGDYLLLICLRNPDQIPTTVSKPDYTKLSREHIDVLFEPHFTIRPDNSHKAEFGSDRRKVAIQQHMDGTAAPALGHAYSTVSSRDAEPQKIAVLFGSKAEPYLRIDPYFMGEPDTAEARQALKALIDVISASLIEVALVPGQCLILDNYTVVHGRRAFKARYDGTDRWQKRINVMRDIRKCRHVLESNDTRVIY
jgi:Fe(II)/alpha-ketoglutarate-dependent arginine beta-hydroxylase